MSCCLGPCSTHSRPGDNSPHPYLAPDGLGTPPSPRTAVLLIEVTAGADVPWKDPGAPSQQLMSGNVSTLL